MILTGGKRRMKQTVSSASAMLCGGNGYPDIRGTALFRRRENGVLVTINVFGLPKDGGDCDNRMFAMHIHDGELCTGTDTDEFADAGTHFNPNHCLHPQHAGDLPPLFGCDRTAYCSVLTNRFALEDIIGKTLIIHDQPDDFTTQPSGNAGIKIACGVIREN